jgi:hypothetical protein
MLDRYTVSGSAAGDTWHENLDHAKGQAEFEYGEAVSEWQEVPEDVQDAVAFAVSRLRDDQAAEG